MEFIDEEYLDLHFSENQPYKSAKNDYKIMITQIVKTFPCLWNKQNAAFRNTPKREAVWIKVADQMGVTVPQAKQLWKKARDSHRYSQKKGHSSSGKSGDPAPEEVADSQHYSELSQAMSFMDESSSVSQRTTLTLGGMQRPRTSSSAYTDTEEPTSPTYQYMKRKKTNDGNSAVSDSINTPKIK